MKLHDGDNIGGVSKFEICLVSDLISLQPILFKPGKHWYTVEHIPQTASFKDDEAETDNGITYTYAGTFKRQFPSKKDEQFFEAYIGPRSIMRITDLNGMRTIIGNVDTPVVLTRSGERGVKPSDMAHHEFKYSVTQSDRAV